MTNWCSKHTTDTTLTYMRLSLSCRLKTNNVHQAKLKD